MLTLSEERKFHLIFAHGSKSSWEREFQEMKVPGSESSMYGTFAPGSESTWERKFLLPWLPFMLAMCKHVNDLQDIAIRVLFFNFFICLSDHTLQDLNTVHSPIGETKHRTGSKLPH